MTWTMNLTTSSTTVNLTNSNNRSSRTTGDRIESLQDARRGLTTLTMTDHLLDIATYDHKNATPPGTPQIPILPSFLFSSICKTLYDFTFAQSFRLPSLSPFLLFFFSPPSSAFVLFSFPSHYHLSLSLIEFLPLPIIIFPHSPFFFFALFNLHPFPHVQHQSPNKISTLEFSL